MKLPLFFFSSLFLTSCSTGYLTLSQDKIDARYLASTHVGTPDPRQAHPPYGQRIIMDYYVPEEILLKQPQINLYLLYWDNTTQKYSYPITQRIGNKEYFLVGEEFDCKKGILSYRAEIVTQEGTVYKTWTHQLWVNLIHIEDEVPESTTESPHSHLDPIEEIYEEEEMSDEFFYPPPAFIEREDLPPVEKGEISPQQHQMEEQS